MSFIQSTPYLFFVCDTLVVSETIVMYSLYGLDSITPAFTVKLISQHSCSMVQGMKVFTSPSGSGMYGAEYNTSVPIILSLLDHTLISILLVIKYYEGPEAVCT